MEVTMMNAWPIAPKGKSGVLVEPHRGLEAIADMKIPQQKGGDNNVWFL